jgi:tetratricopeptide (TPR) repeat protein
MDLDAAIEWLDSLVLAKTGNRLTELQRIISIQVWQGQTYAEIADRYGCTEGHAKDIGSDLWKLLSDVLGERITKKNFRLTLSRHLQTPLELKEVLTEPPNFVGRAEAIAHLNTLAQQGAKAIVIQGEGGLGKTTLAQHYLQSQGFEIVLELLMAKEIQNVTPAERVVEEWLKHDFQEEPGLAFGITLERLKRHLRRRRVGILIDNLEPALDAQGQLIPDHRNYVELLRILSDGQGQGVTLITSRDRLCEASVTLHHYRLPGLERSPWEQFFGHRKIPIHPPTLAAMHYAYGGNAKAMGILAGAIQAEYDSDMESYWQQSNTELLAPIDLKNLVDGQLHRLQNLDPNAYQLFCRLGCYRYQTIPTVPLQGILALLWDIPPSQQRPALVALQNRSSIESSKGEYSLHPVLQEAAIARLKSSPDWQTSHEAAARFWSETVSSIESDRDALKALESFYHYLAIQDWVKAGRVILKSRHNQWKQYLSLGSTLYRMGLVQPLLSAIPAIAEHLQGDYILSELYNILGDVYWITGQIQDAIQVQERAIELSAQALSTLTDGPEFDKSQYYYTMLGVDSRLSIGLYYLDLWELERAADCFERAIVQVKGTRHDRWAEKASVCLALTRSYLGQKEVAHQQADAIHRTIVQDRQGESRGSFAYFIQLLGQTYVNLGMFETAQLLFEKALSFSEVSHYTQVKAKTLTSLAIIQRQKTDFVGAIATHQDAIALLEKIGAMCDLAEAYYQLGMTYREMGKVRESEEVLKKAIALFEAMNAPRQVNKVSGIWANVSAEP